MGVVSALVSRVWCSSLSLSTRESLLPPFHIFVIRHTLPAGSNLRTLKRRPLLVRSGKPLFLLLPRASAPCVYFLHSRLRTYICSNSQVTFSIPPSFAGYCHHCQPAFSATRLTCRREYPWPMAMGPHFLPALLKICKMLLSLPYPSLSLLTLFGSKDGNQYPWRCTSPPNSHSTTAIVDLCTFPWSCLLWNYLQSPEMLTHSTDQVHWSFSFNEKKNTRAAHGLHNPRTTAAKTVTALQNRYSSHL